MDADFYDWIKKESVKNKDKFEDKELLYELNILSKINTSLLKDFNNFIRDGFNIDYEMGKRHLLASISALLQTHLKDFDEIYEVLEKIKLKVIKIEKEFNKE